MVNVFNFLYFFCSFYLKGSISSRSFVRKLAKQSCLSSTTAVTVERKPKLKGYPNKVEIQNLPKLYLVYDFNSKYKHQIPKQVATSTNTKASRDGSKESYISMLQRELSKSSGLGWPFHTRTSSTYQQVLIKPEASSKKSVLHLAMNLPNGSNSVESEFGNGSSSVSFDVIVSPKSRPGWPLLLVSVPPTSDNSSIKSEITKDEMQENQLELHLLLSKALSSGCKRFEYEQLNSATSHFSSGNFVFTLWVKLRSYL